MTNNAQDHGDGSFGPQLWLQFDFTLLFEHTILTILPAALLISASPWYLLHYSRSPEYVSSSLLAWAKLAVTGALFGVEVANLIQCASSPYQSEASLAAAAIACVGAICILALVNMEHRRSLRSSALVGLYLGITLLLDVVKARSYFSQPSLYLVGWLAASTAAIKLAIIVLEEVSKRNQIRNPALRSSLSNEATSGFWNRSLFLWLNTTFLLGFRRIIQADDLGVLGPEFSSERLSAQFAPHWLKRKHEVHSLAKSSLLTLKGPFFAVVIPRLLNIGFTFSQPFLIQRIVSFIGEDNPSVSVRNGLILATILIYSGKAITAATYDHMNYRLVTLLRGVLVSEIFKKTLVIDEHIAKNSAAVTLMSTDVEGLTIGLPKIHEIWACIIEIGLGVYFLTTVVGAASAFVVIPGLITTATALLLGNRMAPARARWNKEIETRVASTSSILGQIKSIRMMGLKCVVADRLQALRAGEMSFSKSFRVIWVVSKTIGIFCFMITPVLIVTTALHLTTFRSGLKAVEIFTTLAFITLTGYPMLRLLNSYSSIMATFGCFKRIHDYLHLKERQDDRETISDLVLRNRGIVEKPESGTSQVKRPKFQLQLPQPPINFMDVFISPAPGKEILLKNVNFSISRTEIVAVMGQTGSGKSTLLRAILGESPFSGAIYVEQRRIAFCDQDPWLQDVSIRENIIGDNKFDQDWYETVLYGCLLREDFRQLPLGDATIAGNSGNKLSGGQKQRVALARAIYSRSTLLLLDDVFSCLDRPTADAIFRRLLSLNGLLRRFGSTVVMTTHSIDHIKCADRILMVESDGSVNSWSNRSKKAHDHVEERELLSTEPLDSNSTETEDESIFQAVKVVDSASEEKLPWRQRGDMKLYLYYIASARKWKWLLWLVLIMFVAGAERVPDIFIRIWVDKAPTDKSWLVGYIILGNSNFIVTALSFSMYYLQIVPDTSQSLHRKLVNTTMECSLSFLSSTKLGSILNLFSQDMSLVSQDLPMSFYLFVYSCFLTLTDIGIITSGSPYMAPIIPFIIILLYTIQYFYLRTSRQIRYLDLEAKTPLYSQFTELIAGLLHIRSFGWDENYLSQSLSILDQSQRPFYFMFCIQRWLGLVIDLAVLGIATILVSTALYTKDQTTQGAIGLALLNLINFGVVVSYLVRDWIDLETALGAISRIRAYAESTPVEQDSTLPLPPGSLQDGSIQMVDVTSTYDVLSSSPTPALDRINMFIKSGQKVAVIGRTGSGKSSLIMTLLNFLDYTGVIRVSGTDVADIPRQRLRSWITTIPQDLVELPGSVRDNIIPTSPGSEANNQITNEQLNEVLERTGLLGLINSNGGLDTPLRDVGFSHGQRQLLGIARAILHKIANQSKIVLVDEATSAVDFDTSRSMHRVIEDEFSDCTIISISHRPENIVSSDIIIKIDDGRIVSIKEQSNQRNQIVW